MQILLSIVRNKLSEDLSNIHDLEKFCDEYEKVIERSFIEF